jgi:predicted enzyme related to lactoylglutathione lyase
VPSTPAPELFSIELRSARWGELVAWYRNVLGLKVLIRALDDGYALLQAGSARLAILERPEAPPASHRWSLGFEVADLAACRDRLRMAGAEVHEPPPNPEGFREIVTHDPDGNRLRLFAWE